MTYCSNRPGFVDPLFATRTCVDVPGAIWFERTVEDGDLEAVTARIYEEIFAELRDADCRPLRLWNFIPRINDGADAHGHGDRERYKAFNRARYAAWRTYDPSLASVCAGTAVGSPDELVRVYGLAVPGDVTHLENPRQTPFLDYSALYGTPPCSRRASVYGKHIFVAGTASIAGESTVVGSTAEQLAETLLNIRTLLGGRACRYDAVRVYVRDSAETDAVGRAVAEALNCTNVVAMTADICRVPLRLEVECIAIAD